MLYVFNGTEPKVFPTVQMTTPDGQPHAAEVQPGEQVLVVAVDGDPAAPVVNHELVPVTPAEPTPAPTEE